MAGMGRESRLGAVRAAALASRSGIQDWLVRWSVASCASEPQAPAPSRNGRSRLAERKSQSATAISAQPRHRAGALVRCGWDSILASGASVPRSRVSIQLSPCIRTADSTLRSAALSRAPRPDWNPHEIFVPRSCSAWLSVTGTVKSCGRCNCGPGRSRSRRAKSCPGRRFLCRRHLRLSRRGWDGASKTSSMERLFPPPPTIAGR